MELVRVKHVEELMNLWLLDVSSQEPQGYSWRKEVMIGRKCVQNFSAGRG